MLILILTLAVILLLVLALKASPAMYDFDEEETVTTTTTVHEPEPHVVGPLKRQVEGDQFFVTDPADRKKIWLNSTDDLYEDADGRVWRLV